jgi:RNA polymerase sigma-70 factor, ECF subfamily
MTFFAGAATPETFKDIAASHIDRLYRVAFNLTKSKADAEDLVQETYLRALNHHEQFDRGTNLRAWLTRILYNLFVNRYHRDRKSISMDHSLEDGERLLIDTMESGAPEPETESLRTELRGKLTDALNELSEDLILAVTLVDIGECSYAEAAEIMSCPIGTIRSRLFRARAILADKLREYVRNA